MVLLITLLQATLAFEILFFLLMFFPTVTVYHGLASRLNPDFTLGTTPAPTGSCTVAPDGCGVCTDISNTGGTIQTVDYPNTEYGPNLNCLFTITAPNSNYKVVLTFQDFVVEQCCDFFSAFDDDATPLQVGLSGTTLPDPISSTKSSMTVKFTSNGDNTQVALASRPARWKASFSFVSNSRKDGDNELVERAETQLETNKI